LRHQLAALPQAAPKARSVATRSGPPSVLYVRSPLSRLGLARRRREHGDEGHGRSARRGGRMMTNHVVRLYTRRPRSSCSSSRGPESRRAPGSRRRRIRRSRSRAASAAPPARRQARSAHRGPAGGGEPSSPDPLPGPRLRQRPLPWCASSIFHRSPPRGTS
jgi:hypothetical protein